RLITVSGTAAEEGSVRIGAGLVGDGKVRQGSQSILQIGAFPQLVAVETATSEKEQLILDQVAHGAQFALITVAIAQDLRRGETAPIHEDRKVHSNQRRLEQLLYGLFKFLATVDP